MSHNQEMIKELLQGLSVLEELYEPPETIAEQFAAWLNQVALALESADMQDELKIWDEAMAHIRFSPDESSFPVQMKSAKAILLGILDKLSGGKPSEDLFPMEILEDAKSYIRRIAVQANGCYVNGWYDACAVMVRRLIETLIIECYENHSLESKIKRSNGNYLSLGDLIGKFLNEPTWNLSRTTKNNLPELKEIGDLSAHNRRFLASRSDIEKHAQQIRVIIQELVYIGAVSKTRQ